MYNLVPLANALCTYKRPRLNNIICKYVCACTLPHTIHRTRGNTNLRLRLRLKLHLQHHQHRFRNFHVPETLCPAREITCQATCQLRGVAGAPELGQSGNCSNTEAWGVQKKWRAGKKSWNRLQIEGKHGVSHGSERFPSGHQVPSGGKGRERQRVSSKETLDKA